MMRLLLFILSLLLLVNASYFVPTKYAFLQELQFSSNASTIAYLSQDVEILLVGFSGDSYNVSVYAVNFTKPKQQDKGKKGPYANYAFYTNLSDATGNISTITATPQLDAIGIGSADRIFRIYIPQINNVSQIVKHQQLTDSYGPILFAAFTLSGEVLSVVSQEGIVRFYLNETVKAKALVSSAIGQQGQPWQYQLFQNMETQNEIGSIAFAPNQTTFYIGYENGSLIGYHYNQKAKGFQYSFIITDTNKRITSISLNQHGNSLVVGSKDGFIRVYTTDIFNTNPKLSQGIYDANKSITQVTMRKDGKVIIATSLDGWTRVYNFYEKFTLNQSIPLNTTNSIGNYLSSNGDMVTLIEGHKIKLYQSCISSISQCSSCETLNTCTGCVSNYYLSSTDGFCHICSLLQGCKSCVTQNMCTSCYSGYFLNAEEGVCEPCVNTLKNCRSCSSKFDCTQCFLQFKLNEGVCQFPVNPDIPVLVPLSNSSKNIEKEVQKVTNTSINTHSWTITLIILIIVLCSLIIVVLVVMIVLYARFMKKLRQVQIYKQSSKMDFEPTNSQRAINPYAIKDDVKLSEFKNPHEKIDEKLKEPAKGFPQSSPVLEPQQKQDPFKQLRA